MTSRHFALGAALAATAATAGAQTGNAVRIAGTAGAAHRLCTTSCAAGEYQAVAFRFNTPVSSGINVKTVRFRAGPKSGGASAEHKVAIRTGLSPAGSEIANQGAISADDVWATTTGDLGAVLLANTTYYIEITQSAGGSNEPSVITAPAGTTVPVGATRDLDARTGSPRNLGLFLRDNAGTWSAEQSDRMVVFVATTTASDTWAPAACGAQDEPFGNPYHVFGTGTDGILNQTSSVGEKFFHVGADVGAQSVSVFLNTETGSGAVTATLTDGAKTVTATLSNGLSVDGYTAWSGTFDQILRLTSTLSYTLAVTTDLFGSFAAQVRKYTWDPIGAATQCSAQARTTWRGSRAVSLSSGTEDPHGDLYFRVTTCSTVLLGYEDVDLDGHGKATVTRDFCTSLPAGWAPVGDDCNDAEPANFPGNPEVCDTKDNDCDTLVDAADPSLVLAPCELTLGVCAGALHTASECTAGGTWTACPDIRYGANYQAGTETICDNLNNDCDAAGVDEGCDDDLDDYCDSVGFTTTVSSACPFGGGDCADTDNTRNPGKPEICNGIDDNCAGGIDAVDPALVLIPCEKAAGVCTGTNRIKEECVGGVWQACDPSRYGPNYQAAETRCDNLDNDCSGAADTGCDDDGDDYCDSVGFTTTGPPWPTACPNGGLDCNDNNSAIRPGAVEVCDGADNDCDTLVDGADGSLLITACEQTLGVCAGSSHLNTECSGGLWQLCPNTRYGTDFETTETRCDGLDNDCDGLTDSADGDIALVRPLCTIQTGVCSLSRRAVAGCISTGWNACVTSDYAANSAFYQTVEAACDARDNDCDGLTDGGDSDLANNRPLCTNQTGVCSGARRAVSGCTGGAWTACVASDYTANNAAYQTAESGCDGVDNDCDGATDAADSDLANNRPLCANQVGVCSGAQRAVTGCTAGAWTGCVTTDYAANNPAVYQATETRCDSLDNDCDGATDADDLNLDSARPLCLVQAGVCAGARNTSRFACVGGVWQSCVAADYQANSANYETSETKCDGLDNDCDTLSDGQDLDIAAQAPLCEIQSACCQGAKKSPARCVSGVWQTCQAADYQANSACYQSNETRCDGLDNDCDESIDANDADLTGGRPLCLVQPGVCLGSRNRDRSACVAGAWQVCGDADYLAHSGVWEKTEVRCDGFDNDCDGLTDGADSDLAASAPLCGSPQAAGTQVGVCQGAKALRCSGGNWLACSASDYLSNNPNYQSAETKCDGLDNDCDTRIDAADADLAGDRKLCTNQRGVCAGSRRAVSGCVGGVWTPCAQSDYQAQNGYELSETRCDGLDNDCDDSRDTQDPDLPIPPCERQAGVCKDVKKPLARCTTAGWQTCIAADYGPNYQSPAETRCDGLDNDCNGTVDDPTLVAAASRAQGGCNDVNLCTLDQCAVGKCTYTPVPNPAAQPCDDGDATCTNPDSCTTQGVCRGTYSCTASGCGLLPSPRLRAIPSSVDVAADVPSTLTLEMINTGNKPYIPRKVSFDCGGFGKLAFEPPPSDKSFGADHYYHAELRSKCPGTATCTATASCSGLASDSRQVGPATVTFTGVCVGLTAAVNPGVARHGETAIVEVNAANLAAETIGGFELVVRLPPGLRFVDGSASGGSGSLTASAANGEWRIADGAHPSAGGAYKFAVQVLPDASGTLTIGVSAQARKFTVSGVDAAGRAVEATASLEVKYSYDLGGCACGAGGVAPFAALALCSAALRRRRLDPQNRRSRLAPAAPRDSCQPG